MVGIAVEMGPTTETRDSVIHMSCCVVLDTIYLNYYRRIPLSSNRSSNMTVVQSRFILFKLHLFFLNTTTFFLRS
ncbi:hypothetical protein P8452_17483 [Trifolium repens]|nr:hypothetical protein P8452_17483 [Trifolium repens]